MKNPSEIFLWKHDCDDSNFILAATVYIAPALMEFSAWVWNDTWIFTYYEEYTYTLVYSNNNVKWDFDKQKSAFTE
jgi:hypothetical protein